MNIGKKETGRESREGRTIKGVLLRREAEPATTPLVEQARILQATAYSLTYGTCIWRGLDGVDEEGGFLTPLH
jgi:hypothetical protein